MLYYQLVASVSVGVNNMHQKSSGIKLGDFTCVQMDCAGYNEFFVGAGVGSGLQDERSV